MMLKNVLLVCTGNSCRSPMAEGLMKRRLDHAGCSIHSAGTMAIAGRGASPEAIRILQERGVDISAHQSRCVSRDMIESADIIFCMTNTHRLFLMEMCPELGDKIHLLLNYAAQENTFPIEVSDPIGKGMETYRQCAEEMACAIDKIVQRWNEGGCR